MNPMNVVKANNKQSLEIDSKISVIKRHWGK